MSIYSDDDSDDIDAANRPGGGLQSEKSPNILARSDVKPILPYHRGWGAVMRRASACGS